MKVTAIVSVLSGLVALGEATCFKSGDTWGDLPTALGAARTACQKNLSGTYNAQSTVGGSRGACINGNNKKLEFQIWHQQDGSRQLGEDECFDGLQKEINSCENGGDTTYTNWRYKADPNAGAC